MKSLQSIYKNLYEGLLDIDSSLEQSKTDIKQLQKFLWLIREIAKGQRYIKNQGVDGSYHTLDVDHKMLFGARNAFEKLFAEMGYTDAKRAKKDLEDHQVVIAYKYSDNSWRGHDWSLKVLIKGKKTLAKCAWYQLYRGQTKNVYIYSDYNVFPEEWNTKYITLSKSFWKECFSKEELSLLKIS